MDGHQRSGQTNGRARIPLQMSINHGDYTPHPHSAYWAKQQSDWAAGDIVFYNRELSLEEIKKVEVYLMRKYSIQREARPHYSNRNFYARERGWLNPFPDCRGPRAPSNSRVWDRIAWVPIADQRARCHAPISTATTERTRVAATETIGLGMRACMV